MKAHYTFDWREASKILLGMALMDAHAVRRQEDVMKLFYHECLRNFGDRILVAHDKAWLVENLEEVCRKNFYVVAELESTDWITAAREAGQDVDPRRREQFLWPIRDPERVFYSSWNPEAEGLYVEVKDTAAAGKVIEAHLERYNDSNERTRLNLILYDRLSAEMLKVRRAISVSGGHLVHISMKGFGMTSVVRLCAYSAGH